MVDMKAAIVVNLDQARFLWERVSDVLIDSASTNEDHKFRDLAVKIADNYALLLESAENSERDPDGGDMGRTTLEFTFDELLSVREGNVDIVDKKVTKAIRELHDGGYPKTAKHLEENWEG